MVWARREARRSPYVYCDLREKPGENCQIFLVGAGRRGSMSGSERSKVSRFEEPLAEYRKCHAGPIN